MPMQLPRALPFGVICRTIAGTADASVRRVPSAVPVKHARSSLILGVVFLVVAAGVILVPFVVANAARGPHLYATTGGPAMDIQQAVDLQSKFTIGGVVGAIYGIFLIIKSLRDNRLNKQIADDRVFYQSRIDEVTKRSDADREAFRKDIADQAKISDERIQTRDNQIETLRSDIRKLGHKVNEGLQVERINTLNDKADVLAQVDEKLATAGAVAAQSVIDERGITIKSEVHIQGQVDDNTAKIEANSRGSKSGD